MCNSNVRQDQDLTEVLSGLLHNAVTLRADVDVLGLTRQLDPRQSRILGEVDEMTGRASDMLRMLLNELPKVTR